ncbi:killer cell immunoglobulin-like receptor 3DS1 isoform X2 [Bufo bufo]|uniref:killer cell immunoglobulin-like receptor 3DS1 isoform X2 n=1 Tax=Bufo bufo TaxID=8384 RepID=UPI001ABE57B2|nr:killer cell immunoglobulin-like receptor 3DS1 isoform X2 [Bufo bufo]
MSSNSFTIVFYMLFPALYLACSNFYESKPEIQAFPSKVVKKGGSVTIRCSSAYYEGMFRLHGEKTAYVDSKHDVREENFTLTNVQEYISINYYCSQYSCHIWSEKSDFLTLKVIDPIKPQISYHLDDSENKQLLIICTAPEPPEECRVKRFLLYSGMVAIKDLKAMGSPKVTFTVSNLTAEYRCSYVLEVKDQPLHLIKSPCSNKITPTIPEDPRIMADYTTTNRIRLVLAIALIILACGFIIEYWISSNKDGQCS